MQNNINRAENILTEILNIGASNAAIINVNDIETDVIFREICKSNGCGMYGMCWMCPPACGEITELIAKVKEYKYALVFNQISLIEDSFDIEGMFEAKQKHLRLFKETRKLFGQAGFENALFLGAGGCGICQKCAKADNKPCAHPELAVSSLEAHGINVLKLAKSAGMKYVNGENTVTYFGLVLF